MLVSSGALPAAPWGAVSAPRAALWVLGAGEGAALRGVAVGKGWRSAGTTSGARLVAGGNSRGNSRGEGVGDGAGDGAGAGDGEA